MSRLGTGLNRTRLTGVELGKRIRIARAAKEMTIQGLADAVGVQPSFINQLESGDRVPSFTTLIHLINALGVSADELLYSYLVCPAPGTVYRPIDRLLENTDKGQIDRIEAHIMLELSMIRNTDQ